MTKNRTEVADIDRSLYDFTYGEEGFERLDAGITPDIVREISAKKDEPQWMLDLRLKSLEIFNRFPDPTWGPSIEGLDMDNIVTYVKPNTDQKHDWESVPDDIKNTFERLGIPDAERSYLAGVGAQYDSELVYHNMQDTASKMGIVYSGIEEAPARSAVGTAHPREVYDAHPAHRPQVCGPARRRVVGRLVCLRSQGHQVGLPAAELLPPQRQGRRPV